MIPSKCFWGELFLFKYFFKNRLFNVESFKKVVLIQSLHYRISSFSEKHLIGKICNRWTILRNILNILYFSPFYYIKWIYNKIHPFFNYLLAYRYRISFFFSKMNQYFSKIINCKSLYSVLHQIELSFNPLLLSSRDLWQFFLMLLISIICK